MSGAPSENNEIDSAHLKPNVLRPESGYRLSPAFREQTGNRDEESGNDHIHHRNRSERVHNLRTDEKIN